MAGPTTEYLAEQLERLRDEVQSSRMDTIDRLKGLSDTFASQFDKIHLHFDDELASLRRDVAEGREALAMEQTRTREDIARLRVQTGELIGRLDRIIGFMKSPLIALIGVGVTLVLAAAGGFWNLARVFHNDEVQERRIEAIETHTEDRAKLRQSLDRLQETLDRRSPPAGSEDASTP
jgi:hypothetical protein